MKTANCNKGDSGCGKRGKISRSTTPCASARAKGRLVERTAAVCSQGAGFATAGHFAEGVNARASGEVGGRQECGRVADAPTRASRPCHGAGVGATRATGISPRVSSAHKTEVPAKNGVEVPRAERRLMRVNNGVETGVRNTGGTPVSLGASISGGSVPNEATGFFKLRDVARRISDPHRIFAAHRSAHRISPHSSGVLSCYFFALRRAGIFRQKRSARLADKTADSRRIFRFLSPVFFALQRVGIFRQKCPIESKYRMADFRRIQTFSSREKFLAQERGSLHCKNFIKENTSATSTRFLRTLPKNKQHE